MKIWENFKTLSEFSKTNASKMSCTMDCKGCKERLITIDTKYVHMVITKANKTRYICDGCLNELKW